MSSVFYAMACITLLAGSLLWHCVADKLQILFLFGGICIISLINGIGETIKEIVKEKKK